MPQLELETYSQKLGTVEKTVKTAFSESHSPIYAKQVLAPEIPWLADTAFVHNARPA